MAGDDLTNPRLGRIVKSHVGAELVRAFVPPSLPPNPPIDVLALLDRLSAAERELGVFIGTTRSCRARSCSCTCMSGRKRSFHPKSRARSRHSPIFSDLRPKLRLDSQSTTSARC